MSEKQPVLCPYRPMFLAYDWEQPSWWPSFRKVRIACASRVQSPLAKPCDQDINTVELLSYDGLALLTVLMSCSRFWQDEDRWQYSSPKLRVSMHAWGGIISATGMHAHLHTGRSNHHQSS